MVVVITTKKSFITKCATVLYFTVLFFSKGALTYRNVQKKYRYDYVEKIILYR